MEVKMSDYFISQIQPTDRIGLAKIDALLSQEDLQREAHLDYTCAMYDSDGHIIATGSCFGSTLRCLAVSKAHQGEGLLNEILTHLIEVQYARGNVRLFLYAKMKSAVFFEDLGFYEIARVDDVLVFMENRRNGFADYLKALALATDTALPGMPLCPQKKVPNSAALVMNANPFTLGHQYLVETAAARCDVLHLFLLSEDTSLIPFSVRKNLALKGIAHLPNVICHDSGPYIISKATFPGYFLKEEEAVIQSHAKLDLAVFTKIAKALSITSRYVGDEPYSQVTRIYNQIMADKLPAVGINCVIVPRKESDGCPISASRVRQYLKEQNFSAVTGLVPKSTLDYFQSDEALTVIERISRSEDVVHY